MTFSRGAIALAFTCLLAVLAPVAAHAAQPAIVVDPGQVQRPISSLLYGFDWESGSESVISDPSSGAFNSLTNSINPNLDANVSDVAPTIIRFPGGTHSNHYDWRRAIGPQMTRGCQYRQWFSSPSSSVFGPDESGRWMEQLGAEMNIVVNSNSLTAQDAGDWVEYMNAAPGANPNGGTDWAQVRANNGHPAPYGVRYWEVGNEMTTNATWLLGAPAGSRTALYASGGSTSFTGQRVGKECRRDAVDSTSDGSAGQEFYAYYPPVVPSSVVIRVGGVTWSRVSSLATAAATATVYTIDATTGRVTFGDGVHGAIPANGAQILIDYTSGPHAGFSDFYSAIKQSDPSAKVCWGTDEIDYDAAGADPLDCVQFHLYSHRPPRDFTDATEIHDWAMARADNRGNYIEAAQRELTSARPGAHFALTEHGIFMSTYGGPTETYLRSLDAGLYVASNLLDFAAAGIQIAQQQQLSTFEPGNEPAGIRPAVVARNMSSFRYYPDFAPQAAAHVINLFRHMLGDTLVSSTVVGNPTRTPAASDLSAYPMLNVGASTDAAGRLTLIVVNRDPSSAVTASVLPRRFAYTGTAEVWTVNGTSTTASNEPDGSTGSVTLTKGTASVAAGGFDRTFPAHSVTAIRLSPPASPPAAPRTSVALGAASATVAPGGSTGTSLTLSNGGSAAASGTVSVVAPSGWTTSATPASWSLAAGGSTSGSLSVVVPASASVGRHEIAVVAKQGGQVTDVKTFTVKVAQEAPGIWRQVFADDFQSGTVGSPPAWSVTGPSGSVTVQSDATAGEKVLAVRRAIAGSTLISASRSLGTLAGDVLVSANVRADQTTAGLGIVVGDASANPIAACAPAATGQWTCMNGSATSWTAVGAYTPGTWQRFELVVRATAYDVYLDGAKVASLTRVSTSAPSQLVTRIAATNTGASSYALDDVAVKTSHFPSVFADGFESDTVGSPPASLTVSGPAGGITVQSHPAGGKMLVVRRATAGSTEIAGTRTFGALSGDVKLSAEVRADQVTAGLGLRLVDSAGDPITACTPATTGQWACTDGTASSFTHFGAYSPGVWQKVDIVLRAATGRVEIYLDGTKHGDVARVSANPPSKLVVRIPTTNTGVSSYALDDVSVSGS